MKKVLAIIALLFMISCASTNDAASRFTISDEEVDVAPGNKRGVIVMENGDRIKFKSSHVFIDRKVIRIVSDHSHQTVLWRNVKKIIISNSYFDETIDEEDVQPAVQPEKKEKLKQTNYEHYTMDFMYM